MYFKGHKANSGKFMAAKRDNTKRQWPTETPFIKEKVLIEDSIALSWFRIIMMEV